MCPHGFRCKTYTGKDNIKPHFFYCRYILYKLRAQYIWHIEIKKLTDYFDFVALLTLHKPERIVDRKQSSVYELCFLTTHRMITLIAIASSMCVEARGRSIDRICERLKSSITWPVNHKWKPTTINENVDIHS